MRGLIFPECSIVRKENNKPLYLCFCPFKLPSRAWLPPKRGTYCGFPDCLKPGDKWLNSELKLGIHYYTPRGSQLCCFKMGKDLVHLKIDFQVLWSLLTRDAN